MWYTEKTSKTCVAAVWKSVFQLSLIYVPVQKARSGEIKTQREEGKERERPLQKHNLPANIVAFVPVFERIYSNCLRNGLC